MPPATKYAGALVLRSLFLGDKDSTAYFHPFLIRKICQIREPASFDTLRTFMFGHLPVDQIDPDAYETTERGYEMWHAEVTEEVPG